jgi:hypothetical protein
MQRARLRKVVEQTESLIPELLERGRAPTGDFPPMQSLGYVEIDRGEDDHRHLIAQLLSPLLDVVTDEEFETGFMTYGEPVSVGLLLDRLDWCVTSDPWARKQFPDWAQQDELQHLEAVYQFVAEKLQDYRLRLLEVADAEEPVPDDLGLPPYDGTIEDLRLFGGLLTINDKEIEISSVNAGDVRGWLFSVLYCQATKLTESQQIHLVEALYYSDRLCLVSQAKWIP